MQMTLVRPTTPPFTNTSNCNINNIQFPTVPTHTNANSSVLQENIDAIFRGANIYNCTFNINVQQRGPVVQKNLSPT